MIRQQQVQTAKLKQRTVQLPQSQFTSKVIGTIPRPVSRVQFQTHEQTVKAQTILHNEQHVEVPQTLTAEVIVQI